MGTAELELYAGWLAAPWAWAHTGLFCAACLGFPWPGGEVLILSHFPILVTLSSSASTSVFKIRLSQEELLPLGLVMVQGVLE